MTDSGLDRFVGLAFWTLGVLCLLNATGLADMGLGPTRAASALTLLCCLLALAGLVRTRPREALGVPGLLLLSCLVSYVGVGIVVAILSGTESLAMRYLKDGLFSILVITAAAVGGRVVWRRLGGERVLMGVLLILAASCTLMLASPWLWDIIPNPPREGAYRFFAPFANPNQAAVIASFTVVTALALLRSGRYRIVAYGVLLVAVVAVVGTISRTAIIVLPIVLLSAVFSARGAPRRRLLGALAIVAVASAGVAMNIGMGMFQEPQLARFRTLADLASPVVVDDVSLAGRISLFELGLDQALESPLVGSGLGNPPPSRGGLVQRTREPHGCPQPVPGARRRGRVRAADSVRIVPRGSGACGFPERKGLGARRGLRLGRRNFVVQCGLPEPAPALGGRLHHRLELRRHDGLSVGSARAWQRDSGVLSGHSRFGEWAPGRSKAPHRWGIAAAAGCGSPAASAASPREARSAR